MLNFFIGFAFFEAGAFFGFFVAALLNAAHGWRRRCSGGHHPHSSAVWAVRLRAAGGFSRLYIRNRSISAVDNSPLS